jgi:phosphatidylserine decarboxylase
MFYSRKEKKLVEEVEEQKKILNFLYNTVPGRICLKSVVARPWVSRVRAKYHKSPRSVKDIEPFMKKHNIELDAETVSRFHSFNDFFIRTKPIRCDGSDDELIAIATSKLSYFPINDDLRLSIKQSKYTIEDIVQDEKIADRFKGGTCMVFRLAVNDYHRYCHIDSGYIISNKFIPGVLHTIRAVSQRFNVFARNSREVTLMATQHLGDVLYVEVGALLVGKIQNNQKTPFNKFDEKGYFEFGGSTVVVLLNQNIKIEFDEDIQKANANGFETQVEIGERIGLICSKD